MCPDTKVAPYLLLLPLPEQPLLRRSWSSKYRQSFTSALRRLKNPERSSTLLVAVAGPFLRTRDKYKTGNEGDAASGGEPGISWIAAQSILAGLYSLVALVCAQEGIATDINAGPNAVDTRIVLVDDVVETSPSIMGGSIVRALSDFASAGPAWNLIFYPKSDQGRGLLKRFLSFTTGGESSIEQLLLVGLDVATEAEAAGQGLLVTRTQQPTSVALGDVESTATHRVVCLGGTFDHLHPGHKLLLSAAALLLQVPAVPEAYCRLIIGITGDELLKNKKFAELVQSWDVRARGVLEYLQSVIEPPTSGGPKTSFAAATTTKTPTRKMTGSFRSGTVLVECVEIQDPYGPTITMEDMDALVVSGETRSGGQSVNEKRKEEHGWKPLKVFEIEVLDAEELTDHSERLSGNFASKISSTAIREQKAATTTAP